MISKEVRVLSQDISAKCSSTIRAIYYYGDGCPMSFWDTFRRDRVDFFFGKIKQDGFNAVIFLVPVGMVILKKRQPRHYEKFLDDLQYLIEKCQSTGLFFMVRIFFVWDSYPMVSNRVELTYQIYSRDHFPDYLSVASDVYAVSNKSSQFLFGFITWEDIIPPLIISLPKQGLAKRKEIGSLIKIASEFSEDGAIPNPDSPIYPKYLSYIDTRFIDILSSLRSVFPALTVEARVDVTPFPLGEGHFGFHFHEKQFEVTNGIDIIGTYYAPYMGAKNEGDDIDASFAFQNFIISQKKPLEVSGGKVFVDQLLLYIDQEKFAYFSKLAKGEIERFVFDYLASWLLTHSVGYANWSFQDYILSATSNSTFQLDEMDGWLLKGEICQLAAGRVSMYAPASITQVRLTRKVQKSYLILEFESINGANIEVNFGNGLKENFDFSGQNLQNIKIEKVLNEPASEFSLAITHGDCVITRCFLGWDFHSNGGYDRNFNPGAVSDILIRLNKFLEAESVGVSGKLYGWQRLLRLIKKIKHRWRIAGCYMATTWQRLLRLIKKINSRDLR